MYQQGLWDYSTNSLRLSSISWWESYNASSGRTPQQWDRSGVEDIPTIGVQGLPADI